MPTKQAAGTTPPETSSHMKHTRTHTKGSTYVTVLLPSHPTKGQCRMQGSPTSHPVLFSQFRPRVAVYRSRRADRCPGDVAPGQENPTSVGVQGTGHDDDPGTEL